MIAVSNLFNIATGDEPASVMQGTVAAIANLNARKGTFKTPYRGQVILLDLIANNPGAAGGALIDFNGNLVGMLGKELRDASTGVWLNYAIPGSRFRKTIGDIIAGRTTTVSPPQTKRLARSRAHNFQTLGLVMVPDVLETTPAFVDQVVWGSPAMEVKLQPDDLILLVEGQRVENQRGFTAILRSIDRRDPVQMIIQRDTEILNVVLKP